MKKLLLTIFLLVSSLAFSAERLVKIENTYMDNKGIVFVAGEETPFTGIVENYKTSEGDKTLSGKVPFKDGLMEGTSKLFYSNGKMASEATFKNNVQVGVQKDYYENGKLKVELPYKNGVVDGIAKVYYPTGKLMSEESYKNDQLDGIVKRYDENGKLLNVDTVVLSVQHNEDVINSQIEKDLKELVIKPVLEKYNLNIENVRKFHINPTGRFVIGGPHGDSGLTGRKIIIDTYGGYFRHGGGAFSGKDPSKVDRSAAYAARWIAKNIVAAGFATKCEVQLSYAIGVVEPVSIRVETFGTGTVEETRIEEAVAKLFDLTPNGIQKSLNLRKPSFRYQDLAAFGHIGRTDIDLPWEKLDKVEGLQQELGK